MIKAAVIGTGRISFLLEYDRLRIKPCTHAGAMALNRKIRIAAACDINPGRLFLFQKQYQVKNGYSRYEEMLKKERPDLLVISTWTDSHGTICREASEAGVPLIVLEKPVAFRARDAERTVSVCQKNRTILMVNHERRYDPLYKKIKELLLEKRIGAVRTVTASVLTQKNMRHKSFRMDKSSLLHDGTHLIDTALFLFGRVKTVTGFIPAGGKDTVFAFLEFAGGVRLFLEAGGERDYFNFELDIQGTGGRIRAGNECRELYAAKKSRQYEHFRELEKVPFPALKKENPFNSLYREAVELLEGKKKIPSSSGLDGLRTMRLLEKISESRGRKLSV